MGLKAVAASSTINNPTFTGTAGFGDGAAATPSIYWTSDSDGSGTGFYRQSANSISAAINGTQMHVFSNNAFQVLSNSGAIGLGTSSDAVLTYIGANTVRWAGGFGTTATSRTEINKTVTAFSNNVAKTVFTVSIPAASHAASIEIQVRGSLGAGGAVGAMEASASNKYVITVTKVTGVLATAAISSAYGAAATAVGGAATVTAVATLTAMTGTTGANTFDIQVTIARSGGSSDNHTCTAHAMLINELATGITIS